MSRLHGSSSTPKTFKTGLDDLFLKLYNISIVGCSIFFTISQEHTECYGVQREANQTSDHLVHGGRTDFPFEGRLLNVPRGVVRKLSLVKPFYFLENSGIDPELGLLALRRG